MGFIMLGQTSKKIHSSGWQRKLRNHMTDAEQMLWRVLRGRQVCGVKFRRQHPFDDYVLDFVSLEIKLVIEVDGGQHDVQADYDALRTNQLREAGFDVLRFWNSEVMQNLEGVKERIFMIVEERLRYGQRKPHPHPDPPLEGEGGLGDELSPGRGGSQ